MNELRSHCGVRLAEAESLLGMLQRRRGTGYLRALETPPETVWPLLLECITNDPRVDPQLEFGDDYYAELIVATGLDLQPLGPHLKRADETDQDVSMLFPTLFCLAKEHNHPQAFEVIEEYASYGQNWESVLYESSGLDATDFLMRIVDVVCRRAESEPEFRAEFEEEVRSAWESYCRYDKDDRSDSGLLLPTCEPWKSISRENPRLAELFANVQIDYSQPGPPRERPSEGYLADLSLEDMFKQVNQDNWIQFDHRLAGKVRTDHEDYLLQFLSSGDGLRMKLALTGLGTLGTPRAFEVITSCVERDEDFLHRTSGRATRAVEKMPPSVTLETARKWFQSKELRFQILGGSVLEDHATTDDIPLLIEALRAPEAITRENYRAQHALVAFTLFRGIGPIPEIEKIFCQTGYCYDRWRAAEAMATTAPDHFANEYAFECLWDSHWHTRVPACDLVNVSIPGAVERLQELAADTHQHTDVQEAAQERLADL